MINPILKRMWNKEKSKLLLYRHDPKDLKGSYTVSDGYTATFVSGFDLKDLNILDFNGVIIHPEIHAWAETLKHFTELSLTSPIENNVRDTEVIFIRGNDYDHLYNVGTDIIGINDKYIQEVYNLTKNSLYVTFYTVPEGKSGHFYIMFYAINNQPCGFILPMRFGSDVEAYLEPLKINGAFPTLPKSMQSEETPQTKKRHRKFFVPNTSVVDTVPEDELPF